MTGFGYSVLGFGSHPSRGPAALSISLDSSEMILEMVDAAANHPINSSAGQIDVTATAAGGDTSGAGYAYAWTVVEEGDDDNTATGKLKILAAGTQNVAQYDSLTLQGDSSSNVGEPFDIVYRLTCTVTDDAGATASATAIVIVALVAL